MIIVNHRVNLIANLKKISKNQGVEIDIRSNNNKLYLEHDSFKKGEEFSKWIKYFNHKLLIANIKEEGIEKKVISILSKENIKNYFLLDVTVPQIINLNKVNITDIALRISKYESFNSIFLFNQKNKWIWIDTIDGNLPINKSQILRLKKNKFKLCLVSPEMPIKRKNITKNFINKHKKILSLFDAVCTKKPDLWKIYEN